MERFASPEWTALFAGVKPALRVWGERKRIARPLDAARARGFAVELIDAPGDARVIAYVAPAVEEARALRALEASILPGLPARPIDAAQLDAHRGLGAALGYPACCVEAFVARVARGVTVLAAGGRAHEDFVAASEGLGRSGAVDARCNVFAATRAAGWVAHVPCRFDCAASIASADRVRAAGAVVDAGAVAALDRVLAVPVAIERDGRRVGIEAASTEACRLGFGSQEGP